MTEFFIRLIEEWGIWGILFSLFIEGSALPFIGTFLIVTVGFLLSLSWFELVWISLLGSLLYVVGSYIPYFIGSKFGKTVEKRLSLTRREKLEVAKATFTKHGFWSVAILSPLHLGNVVPFLAGMSNMKLGTYTLLTMLGIAPSTFLFLSIGQFYDGDSATVISTISEYQSLLLLGIGILTTVYIIWKYYKYQQEKKYAKENISNSSQ